MYDLVFTIDQDVKRRASITYFLNNHGIFAEPFETIDEFIRCWPKTGVVLVHDEDRAIASLMHEICSRHTWLPVVAFSENPEPSGSSMPCSMVRSAMPPGPAAETR